LTIQGFGFLPVPESVAAAPKGLFAHSMDNIALRFESGLVVAISAKPQTKQRYGEDFAIEPRSKMARRGDARCSCSLLAVPLFIFSLQKETQHPMITRAPFPMTLACATLLLSTPVLTGTVHAEEAEQANPLQFYTGDNGSYAKLTIEASLGFFTQDNSWFGNSEGYLGEKSDSWWESLVRPGFEFNYVLADSQALYGQLDGVQANTFGGLDGAGSNLDFGDTSNFRIDHAYVGWKSGKLFSTLGEDFLDISFGRQTYVLGNGFLFANQGGSGGKRAAFWIGGRNTADYAGIIRMKSGNWSGDLVYFEADDIAETDSRVGGANLEYTEENVANIGVGFFGTDSDIDERDSMQIYNIRGGIHPFALMGGMDALKPLRLEAEYAHETKDSGYENGNAWYAAISYEFENSPWKPGLTYRYASFDENWDSLFYGSTDWGTWYQGEIMGEYALVNSNLDSHMLKLKLQPIDEVTINLIYFNFTAHEDWVGGDDIADEYNLIVDWAVNDHLALSVVGGIANPGDAMVEETGGDDNWSYLMLFGAIKF
jgi:hypothetical protein